MAFVIITIFVVCAIYAQNRGTIKYESIRRRMTDYANYLAPINCLFYAFSQHKNKPFWGLEIFPELKLLQDNWQVIRDEALALNQNAKIKASDDKDDLGFNSFFRTGWKRFYLKWYGSNLLSAEQLCPNTLTFLNQLPTVKGAMFAMLPPGAYLGKHRDPYAGSLRYHLGLATPNSDNCFITVDGQKYAWRDGEAVIFDETYIHSAENKTDQNRIILFLDVKRPVTFFLVDWFNEAFSRLVVAASATKNMRGDKVGFLNRLYRYVDLWSQQIKKMKLYNRKLYYFLQYSLYGLLLYWLVIA
jgi:beta-hydroxylase